MPGTHADDVEHLRVMMFNTLAFLAKDIALFIETFLRAFLLALRGLR